MTQESIAPEKYAGTYDLVRHGWLLGQLGKGINVWSGGFEELVDRLQKAIQVAIDVEPDVVVAAPPITDLPTARASGYLNNFPQLAGVITVKGDHDDSGELQMPARAAMVGAACHPFFAVAARSASETGRRVGRVTGHVFRWEPDDDPLRLVCFRQSEHVLIDQEETVRRMLAEWTGRLVGLFGDRLVLAVSVAAANDPFTGRLGALKGELQTADGAKNEILVRLPGAREGVALASSNFHGARLVGAFGGPAGVTSGCVGVGLERAVLAVFRTHGSDPSSWPSRVREVLIDV